MKEDSWHSKGVNVCKLLNVWKSEYLMGEFRVIFENSSLPRQSLALSSYMKYGTFYEDLA